MGKAVTYGGKKSTSKRRYVRAFFASVVLFVQRCVVLSDLLYNGAVIAK